MCPCSGRRRETGGCAQEPHNHPRRDGQENEKGCKYVVELAQVKRCDDEPDIHKTSGEEHGDRDKAGLAQLLSTGVGADGQSLQISSLNSSLVEHKAHPGHVGCFCDEDKGSRDGHTPGSPASPRKPNSDDKGGRRDCAALIGNFE